MALQVRPESTQPASNPRISSNPSVRWGVDSADSIRARGFNTALPGRIYGCNLSCNRLIATCNRLIATKGLVQGGASIYGFFGTPRGLGLATATTSAAFFPHLEQRIRSASSFSVTFQPPRRSERLRLYFPAGATLAHDTHQEVAEAVVQFLDVGEHAPSASAANCSALCRSG